MKLDNISPAKGHSEAELLLRCARTRSANKSCEHTETPLETGIDWEHLFQTADAHGVIPLLYKFLNETCRESVPKHAITQLRDRFIRNAQSNLALTGELLKIFDLLKSHGIPAIAYKGPALAAAVYGDIALRQFVDLDILVRKQDVFDVKEILIEQEYNPEFILTESQKAAFLDNHYDYAFFHNESRALVEIHWEVAEGFLSFPLSVECLLERIQSVNIAGRQVATLSPEDTLLVLCIHGSKHLWARLGWICDVARLIEHEKDFNWQLASERAAALGSRRMFLLGLFLANNLLGAPLPEDVLR
ncbi:MAG TPA: nucleotidyltransferase family protein, partial [Blastocatellia bacterium]|nr:nucleotidyltransferase family protein [Blastocatellia bacterium]